MKGVNRILSPEEVSEALGVMLEQWKLKHQDQEWLKGLTFWDRYEAILQKQADLSYGLGQEDTARTIFEELEDNMDTVHAYAKYSPFNEPVKCIGVDKFQALKAKYVKE